jgi:hypothetical protein
MPVDSAYPSNSILGLHEELKNGPAKSLLKLKQQFMIRAHSVIEDISQLQKLIKLLTSAREGGRPLNINFRGWRNDLSAERGIVKKHLSRAGMFWRGRCYFP